MKQTAADTKTLASASKTVAALLLDPGASGTLLTLGTGVTLTVGAGELITTNQAAGKAFSPTITGGTLAFGGSK